MFVVIGILKTLKKLFRQINWS